MAIRARIRAYGAAKPNELLRNLRAGDKSILVTSRPGKGDVAAITPEGAIAAECKGGIVNTRHPGQVSRLRKGLCEAIGLLMTREMSGKQIAVVPYTPITLRLAQKMEPRATAAGIQIALVDGRGRVIGVGAQSTCQTPVAL